MSRSEDDYQDTDDDDDIFKHVSNKQLKDHPRHHRKTQKHLNHDGTQFWSRTTKYVSKQQQGCSSDDSILSTSAVQCSGQRRVSATNIEDDQCSDLPNAAFFKDYGQTMRGEAKYDMNRQAYNIHAPENVDGIYAELQNINAKLKDEFRILNERGKVLKERERVLVEAESDIATAKTNLDITLDLEVKQRVAIKEAEHRAQVESLEQALKEKTKENKRLKENFDTLKVANDTLRRELENVESAHTKIEKQATSLQARLTNLQRKNEHEQRRVEADLLPPDLGKAMKATRIKDAQKAGKIQMQKPHVVSYDVLTVLLEWISDVHLRNMVTDQPSKPLDLLCSSQTIQEKCLKVLPCLVEIIREVPSTHPTLVVPCLQFIHWSLLHMDATHAHGSGGLKINLSSTLRRLGEELYKSRMVRFAEDETNTVTLSTERLRDKEGVFFRSPVLHIRFLSSLVILRSLNQVDHLAHVFEVLKTDLKNDMAKQLFLHYQATAILIPYLRPTNKALLQAAVDVHLGMSVESSVLAAFLEACSSETWFRAIGMVLRMPNVDEKVIEKLSILLQKLSKIKTNRRFFEVFGLTGATQELHRTASGTTNAFLTLNLKSILFNLNVRSPSASTNTS